MPKRLSFSHGENNLIATLPEPDRVLIEPHLKAVDLGLGKSLEKPGERVETVYFPLSGVGSMVAVGSKGRRIEAGLFGREGMSGSTIVTAAERSPHETFIQVAGHGLSIEAGRLRELMDTSPSLTRHLLRYTQALFTQTAHTALSNGQAKLEERLARWLLMCHDRLDGDDLELTHDFLAVMLGVRRAGVTVGTHLLEGKGLIRAVRKRITIMDREGLEVEAQQSYGVPESEYIRLIG